MAFLLVNMQSRQDANKFAADKGLKGGALHAVSTDGAGGYGVTCIPHKVLLDKDGKVVANCFREALTSVVERQLAGAVAR